MASLKKMTIFPILYLWVLLDYFSPAVSDNSNDDNNWNTNDFQKREHSLTKPYHHGGAGGRPLWDFGGNAIITSNYVRLTADKQGSKGYIWNAVPVHLRAWEMHVHFKVWSPNKKDLFGDGFALWYTKDRMQSGMAEQETTSAVLSLFLNLHFVSVSICLSTGWQNMGYTSYIVARTYTEKVGLIDWRI